MFKTLLCASALCLSLSSLHAQTWTRPAGCPDPETARLKLAERLAVKSTSGQKVLKDDPNNPQVCNGGACDIKVVVTPPVDGGMCFASIDQSPLLVKKGKTPRLSWKIDSTCPVSQCKFARLKKGITILEDKDGQVWDESFSATSPRVYKLSDRNSLKDSFIRYEPHVFWKTSSSPVVWQSCCPIDPRISNEGP